MNRTDPIAAVAILTALTRLVRLMTGAHIASTMLARGATTVRHAVRPALPVVIVGAVARPDLLYNRCVTASARMSMSSLTGKRILSLIRDGDFAHPGETEAIDLVLDGWPRDPSRRVLDLGCGLGGTAALIAQRGYGRVSGVDADPDTIAYAQHRYPEQAFHCASAAEVSRALRGPLDAIVMFTSFYCFPDQEQVLRECRMLAHAGTEMRVFDYSTPTWSAEAQEFCVRYARGGHWKPLVMDEVDAGFARNGWTITSRRDLTAEYRRWYQELMSKIEAGRDRIVQASGERWYDYAYQRYDDLLIAIEQRSIGGAMICAAAA